MEEKYNGLNVPILLFQKDNHCRLVPVANLQPGYGPWDDMDAAKAGLIEIFEDIANVPAEYTFCVMNNFSGGPKEWWFTEKGVWETVAPKSVGDDLEAVLLFRYNDYSQDLEVSYDGGDTWTALVNIPNMTGNYITNWEIDKSTGEIKISYDNGHSWFSKGKIKFEITNTGYFKYSFDGGTTWHQLPIVANSVYGNGGGGGTTPSGSGEGGPLDNITSENVGSITFQNTNDSSAGTYTGIDACNVIIYMATDYPTQLSTLMETRYPNVAVGSYIIIRSTLFDRTGGMSNASDATHTYELDPAWTTQDVLDNSVVNDWFHYFKITKVDVGKWVGVAWIGRTTEFVDTVRHKVYIDTITPAEASVVITYNGVDTIVRAGEYITVDDGASVTITGTAEGYNNYSTTLTNITSDQHVNVSLTQVAGDTVLVYFGPGPSEDYINGGQIAGESSRLWAGDGVWGVTTDNFQTIQYYRHSLGFEDAGLYEFPRGTTIKVFYYCAYNARVCYNVGAWNLSEGISSGANHPSKVLLARGLDQRDWNSYTLNEDTVFDPMIISRQSAGSGAGPSLPQDEMLLIFDRVTPNGDAKGSSYHNMDTTGHFNVTITFEDPSPIPGRPPRNREVITKTTTDRYVFITQDDIPDWAVNGGTTFVVTAELVGSSTTYRCAGNINAYWSDMWRWHDMVFLPSGYYSFEFGDWDPTSLHLIMNDISIMPSDKYTPRYFTNGTVFNCSASADLYYTKTWTDVMPADDYTMPAIVLERDYS